MTYTEMRMEQTSRLVQLLMEGKIQFFCGRYYYDGRKPLNPWHRDLIESWKGRGLLELGAWDDTSRWYPVRLTEAGRESLETPNETA